MTVEVRTRSGWVPLRPGAAPTIDESLLFELRGLIAGSTVVIGTERRESTDGTASIRLADIESLRGHLGLIEVVIDGRPAGEIDVRPDKLSEPAYRALRADLQRTWTGLVFDPEGISRLQASLPPPADLWARIEKPVRDIAAMPRERLVDQQIVRRANQARRARELTPSVVRAAARGGAGLARAPRTTVLSPETAMVADALHRLRGYAAGHPDGQEVATSIGMILRQSPFKEQGPPVAARPTTWGMRADQRYRRVHAVYQVLMRPELEPTEGPGELRLGVQGMIRLFEYWVFLQVLIQCASRFGPPEPPGFAPLARPLPGGRARLDLPAGTTVTFPGNVHVAFEPSITARGDGWMGLEYVPHPDPTKYQGRATPDVVVFADGDDPWALVVDAKYVGRSWVERASADIHAKYSRMRRLGIPVVRNVMAVHPHQGLQAHWAGYGHLGMSPGGGIPALPFSQLTADGASASPT